MCTPNAVHQSLTMVEEISFLESSSIHGLIYISSTRKYLRLFWITAVFGGFLTAGYLIQTSFNNWKYSPISTTIETLSINEITFPNVTVCPPKGSYLNLNHDIKEADRIEIDEETRKKLLDRAITTLQDKSYEELMKNLSKVEDPNRYHNWYLGFTQVNCPYFEKYKNNLYYNIYTTARSGNITTKHFGDMFDADKVDRNIEIYVSFELASRKFAVIDIEKITMTVGDDEFKYGEHSGDKIDADLKHLWENVTGSNYKVSLDRKLSMDDIDNVNLDTMPGFKLTWYSDTKSKPNTKFKDSSWSAKNDVFRR